MFEIALFGAGKIGEAICALLIPSGKYTVRIADHNVENARRIASRWAGRCSTHVLDTNDAAGMKKLLGGCSAVLSALPYFCNINVAKAAKETGVHYLDLTEDVQTTKAIQKLSEGSKSAFMPQCGLAPGFISIAAAHLVTLFDEVESVRMRVGALPVYPSNRLKYNLTWSTDGLINEYGNMCEVVANGEKRLAFPLEGYETFALDGVEYEAFNTSGGLGTLSDTLHGRVANLNYKTIRYPGHRDLIAFLMNDLKLNDHRKELGAILERSVPATKQDKCIVYVEAKGKSGGRYLQKTYASTVYSAVVNEVHLSAIQITTAAGICAPLDLLLTGKMKQKTGFLTSEAIPLPAVLENEFGRHFRDERALSSL